MSEPDFSMRRPLWQTSLLMAGLGAVFSVLMFQGSLANLGTRLEWMISIGLGVSLLGLSWIDLDRYLLPDLLTLPLLLAGLTHSVLIRGAIWQALAGAVIGYILIAGLAAFWRRRFGREGIGLGDAKLLAAGGAWLGGYALPLILLVASGTLLALTLVMNLTGKKTSSRTALPFGPALALGIWGVWCFPGLVT